MKIQLIDTFNDVKISSHNTLKAAVQKQRNHLAAVKRANGESSYLTYAFRYVDGTPVDSEEITQMRINLDQSRV